MLPAFTCTGNNIWWESDTLEICHEQIQIPYHPFNELSFPTISKLTGYGTRTFQLLGLHSPPGKGLTSDRRGWCDERGLDRLSGLLVNQRQVSGGFQFVDFWDRRVLGSNSPLSYFPFTAGLSLLMAGFKLVRFLLQVNTQGIEIIQTTLYTVFLYHTYSANKHTCKYTIIT